MNAQEAAMYDCTHGPVKDCTKCLVPQLVKALETAMARREPGKSYTLPVNWFRDTRALINKAKVVAGSEEVCSCEPRSPDDGCPIHGFEAWQRKKQARADTIPYDEAPEAATNQGHRYG
jgi:hypothetical protein